MSIYRAVIVVLLIAVQFGTALAQQCNRPAPPEVAGDRYKALQKRAANAAFLADECGFDSEVQKKYVSLVKLIFDDSVESQQSNIDDFKSKKNQFSGSESFLKKKMRCFVETGKTRAFINDAADDVSSYADLVTSMRKKHFGEMEAWNSCLARQQAAARDEENRIYCCCEVSVYKTTIKADFGAWMDNFNYEGSEYRWGSRENCSGTVKTGGLLERTKTVKSCTSRSKCGY